jgi:hypothetical protein
VSGTALGPTQLPIQWVPEDLSLGIKRPGREADHSPPSNAEVKNAWIYTSAPQYVFVAWCLVKHRDDFTFTFTLFIAIPTATGFVTVHLYLQKMIIIADDIKELIWKLRSFRCGTPFHSYL